MLSSKCMVCDSKITKFIKEQEASGLLKGLGTNTLLSKIPLVGSLLFQSFYQVNTRCKVNKVVNRFLVQGDKFMHEMNLKQLGFTYSACEYRNIKKQEIHNIFIKTNQIKFVLNMA